MVLTAVYETIAMPAVYISQHATERPYFVMSGDNDIHLMWTFTQGVIARVLKVK